MREIKFRDILAFADWDINFEKSDENLKKAFQEAIDKTRKETIKEILTKISKIPKIEMTFSDIKEALKDK